MLRSRLLMTTAFATAALLPAQAADMAARPPLMTLPAVDGFNGKADIFFGGDRYRTLLGPIIRALAA